MLVIIESVLFIIKCFKLKFVTDTKDLFELQSFLLAINAWAMFTLALIDAVNIYRKVYIMQYKIR